MTLDERGRAAAEGLQATVQAAIPTVPPFPPAPFLPGWLRPALTFVMAAVVVAAGAFLISRPTPEVVDTPDPDVPEVTVTTGTSTPESVPVDDADQSVPADTSGEHTTSPSTVSDAGAPLSPPPEEADVTPPTIEIVDPVDGAHFTDSRLQFSGITEPGATVFFGPYEADVDEAGNWSIVLILSDGGNRATAVATDPAGNTAEDSVVVYLDTPATTTVPKDEPPEEPPKEDPPAAAPFHAEQTYGECAEDPPYDVFHGTGEPGHTVKVSSDYGSGTTTIDGEGGFEIQVFFPSAPIGETFAVTVKDKDTGESFVFEFVHTG